MPLPQRKEYTIEDIYSLSEGTRAELIDGQIYYMVPPTRRHQRLLLSISHTIADYIDKKGSSCEVDIAPFAVFLNEDDRNYVEPDISVICDTNKLTDRGCSGAPDWIIEIVSPGSKRMDYFFKLFKYQATGVYSIKTHVFGMLTSKTWALHFRFINEIMDFVSQAKL